MTEKNAFTIPEFVERNSVSRSTAYRERAANRLAFIKIRGRTLITAEEEARWLRDATQPAREPNGA